MAVSIVIPKLGWGTEPLTLVEWKAKEGNRIEQGDVVLVVTTEKITSDVEAKASGYLHIVVEEGNEAAIGSAVGLIVEAKEELAVIQREPPKKTIITIAESKEAPPFRPQRQL